MLWLMITKTTCAKCVSPSNMPSPQMIGRVRLLCAQNTQRHCGQRYSNSLALRLPAALGLEAGMEMELTPDGAGGYHLRAAPLPARKFNVDAIWGICKGMDLQPNAPEGRIFDDVKRPWDDPDWPGWGDNG
jgi:hypothetical protein